VRGTVSAFDDRRGVGEIEAEGERYFFHCTQLADRSRSIPVGTEVEFEVTPGLPGRWEATVITAVG
jgi:cold shock CspA family protein